MTPAFSCPSQTPTRLIMSELGVGLFDSRLVFLIKSISPAHFRRTTTRVQRTVLINAEIACAVAVAGLCGP